MDRILSHRAGGQSYDLSVELTCRGAHAPDEYYIIESANPKVQGFDGAIMSFVEYLYELAK
jgi:hypothetical protein